MNGLKRSDWSISGSRGYDGMDYHRQPGPRFLFFLLILICMCNGIGAGYLTLKKSGYQERGRPMVPYRKNIK